jgi:hypothetical protein
MRMMMMRTGQMPQRRVVEGAVLPKVIAMTTTRVRRTHRGVRHGPGKRSEHRIAKGKGRAKGWGRERQWGKGRGREPVKEKVILNKPHGDMISLVLLRCSGRRKYMRKTQTRRANWSWYI